MMGKRVITNEGRELNIYCREGGHYELKQSRITEYFKKELIHVPK